MALIENILVIIVVVIVLVIIYNIFFTKTDLLISGIIPTTPLTTIQAKQLQPNISSNFAWSIWFYINEWNQSYGQMKTLFYQANEPLSSSGLGTEPPNIAVSLDEYENNMSLWLNTFKSAGSAASYPDYQENQFTIPNIDLQKWVNLIISVEGRTLDVYLHGKLVKTYVLPNVAYVKSENVYIGGSSAAQTFDGHVARLQYFANSLNTQQAYNIYRDGIDSNLISDFFNKYKLKIQFLEYNTPVGNPLVL